VDGVDDDDLSWANPERPGAIPEPTPDEVRLMALLATGMTDEDAARRLGWTRWTLRRRLRTAMDKLESRSRLQAGYRLAQTDWLERL
jgi:DNA-binding NarL/FixJ family response regulator